MKRKKKKLKNVLFIDPTHQAITLSNGGPKYISDPRFAAFMYAEKSIFDSFQQGELKSFGFTEWKEVQKILQPAILPRAILQFVENNNSFEENDYLTQLYTSPICREFPSSKPFVCIADGHSYSADDYKWFARTKKSPMNRAAVDLSNDLISDPVAEAILNSEIKDFKTIFKNWRQPAVQSYDIPALNNSPFLGYDYFMLYCFSSLVTNCYQLKLLAHPSSAPYFIASFFLTMEKLRKLQEFLFWSKDSKEESATDDLIRYRVIRLFTLFVSFVNLTKKLLPEEPLIIMIFSLVEVFAVFYTALPHIKAWDILSSKYQNILSDVRKILNTAGLTKTLALSLGTFALIGSSSRFPDSIESLWDFDPTLCSIAIAPTFALPMLDYTVRQLTSPRLRVTQRIDLKAFKKFLWPFIIAVSAFLFTLMETNNPLCALSTAILMAFSVNLDDTLKKYNKFSGNPYILSPLKNNESKNIISEAPAQLTTSFPS